LTAALSQLHHHGYKEYSLHGKSLNENISINYGNKSSFKL